MIPEPPEGYPSEVAGLLRPLEEVVEGVRLVAGVAALALLLVLGGALLERQLLKRRLQVVHLETAPDAEPREASVGRRG